MTNKEFAAKLIDIAKNYKTLYVNGCFGAPMTDKNKERYLKNTDYNKKPERTAMIKAASADTFGFDCVCLLKGVMWGWCGNLNHVYGGAVYKSNDVPDIGADSIIKVCADVSTDFENIEIGELVWMEGHVGAYVGNGLAVECSPKWENKVQITACNRTISGYNRRNWTKHGKLPYIEYLPEEKPKEEQSDLKTGDFGMLDVVKLKETVDRYTSGQFIPSWLKGRTLFVRGFRGENIVVSTLKEGDVTGIFYPSDLILVEKAKAEKEEPVQKPAEEKEPEIEPKEEPAQPKKEEPIVEFVDDPIEETFDVTNEPEVEPQKEEPETSEDTPDEDDDGEHQEELAGEENTEGSNTTGSPLKRLLVAIIDFLKALLGRL